MEGDMDLHADTVTLIERGYPISHDCRPGKYGWLCC